MNVQSVSQQQWTADQRRQQIAELLRNKGVICKDYLQSGRCPRSPSCPYMHVADGETRPIPWSICSFFSQGVCLRDQCAFFHGTSAQLEELHSSGITSYRPQDYMKIAAPPAEYLNPDGSIVSTVPITPIAPTPTVQMVQTAPVPPDNAVNAMQPFMLVPPGHQAIAPPMFGSHMGDPNLAATQFSFYQNAPIGAHFATQAPPGAIFQPAINPFAATTFYPTAATAIHPTALHQLPVTSPHSQQQQQQAASSPLYFHIQ